MATFSKAMNFVVLALFLTHAMAACPFASLLEGNEWLADWFMPSGHPPTKKLRNPVQPRRKMQNKPKPAPAAAGPAPKSKPAPAAADPAPKPKPAPAAADPAPKPKPAPGAAAPAPAPVTTTATPSSARTYMSAAICKTTVTAAAMTSATMCSIRTSVARDLDALLATASNLQKARIFGSALRLAFHDAAEISTDAADKLGADGCLSQSSENFGLVEATSLVATVIEPLWQKNCALGVSRADFWVLFAKLCAERSAALGGATITVPFYYGRKDNQGSCNIVSSRQPDALSGSFATTTTFFNKMGLSVDDVVALLGAHSVGHMSISNSGFGDDMAAAGNLEGNSWDQTPHILDNNYYRELVNKPWDIQPANALHKQDYADRGSQRNGDAHIMLNSDMALAFPLAGPQAEAGSLLPRCGGNQNTCAREQSSRVLVDSFIGSNAVFVNKFATALAKMSNAGFSYGPTTGIAASASGKLGALALAQC